MIRAVALALAMLAARFARALGCFLLRATRLARRRRADASARDAPSCLPSVRRSRIGATDWPTTAEEATAVDPLRDVLENRGEAVPETMRSVRSDRAVRVTFRNTTDEPVRAYWLAYDGRVKAYNVLRPGEKHEQRTYDSHPWTFLSCSRSRQRCVVNDSFIYRVVAREDEMDYDEWDQIWTKREEVEIRRPTMETWSMGNHSTFCDAFKLATRAFLLAHKRLEREGDGRDLGALPTDLVVEIIERAAPIKPKYVWPTAETDTTTTTPTTTPTTT